MEYKYYSAKFMYAFYMHQLSILLDIEKTKSTKGAFGLVVDLEKLLWDVNRGNLHELRNVTKLEVVWLKQLRKCGFVEKYL